MSYELKIHPKYMDDILYNRKRFEVRKEDDKHFEVNQKIKLREYDPITNSYTGRYVNIIITYILRDPNYVSPDYCIFGFKISSLGKE